MHAIYRVSRLISKCQLLRQNVCHEVQSNLLIRHGSQKFTRCIATTAKFSNVVTEELPQNDTKDSLSSLSSNHITANDMQSAVDNAEANETDLDAMSLNEVKTVRNPFWNIEKDVRNNDGNEMEHFIDDIAPTSPASFNLAAFANKSTTLKKLVELNVDLSRIEKVAEQAKFLMKLDFDRDISPYIQFLTDKGVSPDDLGNILTRNPGLLKADLDNLQIRINYLQSKKFSDSAIARIISKNPFHLALDTRNVDRRLGFLQQRFNLSGDEVRFLVTKSPKIVVYEHQKLMDKILVIKDEMGFTEDQMKQLLLMKPKVWMLGRMNLWHRFDLVHNTMGISHERILQYPGILLKRTFLLDQRHKYLVHLGKAQYDPTKPCYVSLIDLATTTDNAFCKKCAKMSVVEYNEFLKKL